MEADTTNTRSAKRKPFSDRTNINPTSTIFKLPSDSQFPKSSNPKSNPLQFPKPLSYFSKPRNRSTGSSKSNSSVGSTNNSTTRNDRTTARVLQTQPSTPIAKPFLPSQSENIGTEKDEIIEPLIVYGRKSIVEKTGNKKNMVAVPFNNTLLLEKTNDKDSVEKIKDKGKGIAVASTMANAGIRKDKHKAIALPVELSALLNRMDKEKAIDRSFGSDKSNDKAKSVVVASHHVKQEKGNDRRRVFSASFSSSPSTKVTSFGSGSNLEDEDEGEGLRKFQTDPYLKRKKKRRIDDSPTCVLSKEFIEKQRAYFKEIDEFELAVEEVSDEE